MAWKDLKRFWSQDALINQKISDAFDKTNRITEDRSGLSLTQATALAYAIIDSAKASQSKDAVIHLVIGSYNIWPVLYVHSVLQEFGYNDHKVALVSPKFAYSAIKSNLEDLNLKDQILVLRHSYSRDLGKLRKYNLGSIYVHLYEYMFNWEYYDLDLSPDCYIVFDHVRTPIAKFYTLDGWTVKGKYGSMLFVRRTKDENRSNDTNQREESESTGQDL